METRHAQTQRQYRILADAKTQKGFAVLLSKKCPISRIFFLQSKIFCLFTKCPKQHRTADQMMFSGVVSGELRANSMCAIYDVSDDVSE